MFRILKNGSKKLANLKVAIALLFIIGILIALGTFIEQDQTLAFYKENYPETKPIWGFIDWKFLINLNLNQIYTAPLFLFILLLFGSSLLACTFTTQLPVVRKFRLWQFFQNSNQYRKLAIQTDIEKTLSNTFSYGLHQNNYHNFRQGKTNYSYKGLFGRIGPIVVHFSIILLMIGSSVSSFTSYNAQEVVPRGEIFHLQNLIKSGNISQIPQDISWRVNDFWITYTDDLKTNQFYSDISALNQQGIETKRKKIFVNEPFVNNGLTIYQTDWNIVGLKVQVNEDLPIQLPLQKINKNGRRFWFTSVPLTKTSENNTLLILINDLRGNVLVYDKKGTLLTESTIGSKIAINQKSQITFNEFITSTGLQIKKDPGIPIVYFSFFFLMVSIYVSFLSYSQIWELESNFDLITGGTSNRAVLSFQEEFRRIVKTSRTRSLNSTK